MTTSTTFQKIAIYEGNILRFIDCTDIVYFQTKSGTTQIKLSNGDILISSKSLKEIEMMINYNDFFRVHNSFIININHLDRYKNSQKEVLVMKDLSEIQLSRRRKQEFFNNFIKL